MTDCILHHSVQGFRFCSLECGMQGTRSDKYFASFRPGFWILLACKLGRRGNSIQVFKSIQVYLMAAKLPRIAIPNWTWRGQTVERKFNSLPFKSSPKSHFASQKKVWNCLTLFGVFNTQRKETWTWRRTKESFHALILFVWKLLFISSSHTKVSWIFFANPPSATLLPFGPKV